MKTMSVYRPVTRRLPDGFCLLGNLYPLWQSLNDLHANQDHFQYLYFWNRFGYL